MGGICPLFPDHGTGREEGRILDIGEVDERKIKIAVISGFFDLKAPV